MLHILAGGGRDVSRRPFCSRTWITEEKICRMKKKTAKAESSFMCAFACKWKKKRSVMCRREGSRGGKDYEWRREEKVNNKI